MELGLIAIGAGLAVGLTGIGAGWAEKDVGAAAVGAMTEDASLVGKGMILMVLLRPSLSSDSSSLWLYSCSALESKKSGAVPWH